jgi:hypothetical protein
MVEPMANARDNKGRAEDVNKDGEKEGRCRVENLCPFEHRGRAHSDKLRALVV